MKLKNTGKGGVVLLSIQNKYLLLFVVLMITHSLKGQVLEMDTLSPVEYPFINYEADTLINADHLAPFFEKLLSLENGDSCQISILHIGDSHIQADYLTGEIRKDIQLRFGNAGRGLVFPLRVAGTNEPADYRSATNAGWSVGKINGLNQNPEPGISGISVMSGENGAYIDFTTLNHDDLDYSFDQVTLIHTKDSRQYDCRIIDSVSKSGYLMSAGAVENGLFETRVPFVHPTNFVRIQAEQTESGQNSIAIHGLILQNSDPGILYHSVGINGAHFNDYNNSPLFFRQVRVLGPDLVIISLGANEGANIKISAEEISASISSMIQKIKSSNPGTCILIATPADDYFRKKYHNPYLETVQRALILVAEKEGVAVWDLYNITGGLGSCSEWRKNVLMQRDGVHFTKRGYTAQGELLYKALMDSYLKYAAD